MSYLKTLEFKVVPKESFKIIHNCSGCGSKSIFQNTNCFRINANGNCIDVWLIYQCNKCKHTYNIPIFERIKPKNIKREEYEKLLENDYKLAFKYGTDLQLMKRCKAEIDWGEMDYQILGDKFISSENMAEMVIMNPANLKIRTEKILSEIMEISRQEVKKMQQDKTIFWESKTLGSNTKIQYSF